MNAGFRNDNLAPLALDASSSGTSSKHVGGVIDYFLKEYRKPRKPYSGRTYDQLMVDIIARIDRSAGPNGCWIWTRGKTRFGYGDVVFKGKLMKIHRLVWTLTTGPIPPELELCHRCDNPPCCNPNHLFPGTHKENMRDMFRKGRRITAIGERAGSAKLTAEKVILLRKLYATGKFSFSSLGTQFGVSKTQARSIVKGRKWKHLPLESVRTRKFHENRKLNRASVKKLRADYATRRFTTFELGEKYGIHQSTVVNVGKGRNWKKPVDSVPMV